MVRPDLHLPQAFVAWMAPFLTAFCQRSRDTTAALAVGALMAIGPRTVTNCLRALGLAEHPSFTAFHRVLTGAPSERKMRNRVAALVSANPSICRDGHRVLAAGRPD